MIFYLNSFPTLDQAIADPSKVEMKVVEQMQRRRLNHEMRNQAAKLTPAERKEKKSQKAIEDTSRHVNVAVFAIRDFSNGKQRFKVDVNAQQNFLSGTGMGVAIFVDVVTLICIAAFIITLF